MKSTFLTKLESKVCDWLLHRLIKQGRYHHKIIEELYARIRLAAMKEFYEDNIVTVDTFLTECYTEAQKHKPATKWKFTHVE